MEKIEKIVGDNIRRFRKDVLNLTQEELEELTGITVKQIQRIEGGRGNPTTKTIEKIAKALGIAPEELFRSSGSSGLTNSQSFLHAAEVLKRFAEVSSLRRAVAISVLFGDISFAEAHPKVTRPAAALLKAVE